MITNTMNEADMKGKVTTPGSASSVGCVGGGEPGSVHEECLHLPRPAPRIKYLVPGHIHQKARRTFCNHMQEVIQKTRYSDLAINNPIDFARGSIVQNWWAKGTTKA